MINFDELIRYMDSDVIYRTLRTYQNDYADGLTRINALYQAKSWSSLFLLAHSLKTLLIRLREPVATRALERIETNTSQDNAPSNDDIELLNKELRKIDAQVNKYLTLMD